MTADGADGGAFPPGRTEAFAFAYSLMLSRILALKRGRTGPLLVGICGAQGSGKSFTASRLVTLLEAGGTRAVTRSIDDFYLTRAERADLAETVHPLLATRGVPGTHDLKLLDAILDQLIAAGPTTETALPEFDKLADDRVARDQWPVFIGRPDVIILDGWCVGARAQPDHALSEPVNDLEAREDPGLEWRRFVNRQLTTGYATLFARLALIALLRAPSFARVLTWRREQEMGLRSRGPDGASAMSDDALKRFISHYERLTTWILADEPADLVVDLADDRAPLSARAGNRR